MTRAAVAQREVTAVTNGKGYNADPGCPREQTPQASTRVSGTPRKPMGSQGLRRPGAPLSRVAHPLLDSSLAAKGEEVVP
jgi:hypothetical protein